MPYPPPAALAEVVPASPSSNAVWLDGEWLFEGRTYLWQRGGWTVPPTGSRFAPWRFHYLPDARLVLAPGTWYGPSGARIEPPEFLVPASTPLNQYTPEPGPVR